MGHLEKSRLIWYLCVCRGSKYFKVVSDWLILDADLYGTILVGGPLRTQFDDVAEMSPKSIMIQDMINSKTVGIQLNRQTQIYSRSVLMTSYDI